MTLTSISKGALRGCKNTIHGYSSTQARVRQATSNDPWPASGKTMHEIAQLSYLPDDFADIIEILDKRLNDKGKYWRHVFKGLSLVDYLLHSGTERFIAYYQENIYIIKTLREFQYVDETGRDQGLNVRQKAKDITNLLLDAGRLRDQRKNRTRMRDRMLGYANDDDTDESDHTPAKRSKSLGEAEDLRRATEDSRRAAEKRRATTEDRDMQRALKLSEEAEAKRAKAVAEANKDALFNDAAPRDAQKDLIDISIPQQYTSNPPMQLVQLQPQYTVVDPWMQQQAQQNAMQAEYTRQQMEWQNQVQQAQFQQAQQEEWIRQQQQLQLQQYQQQQQPIIAQPTAFASNNPFASTPPIPYQPTSSAQTLPARSPAPFSLQGTYSSRDGTVSAPPLAQHHGRADQEHAHLASLFANRAEDGVDTFGNVGRLRFGPTHASRLIA